MADKNQKKNKNEKPQPKPAPHQQKPAPKQQQPQQKPQQKQAPKQPQPAPKQQQPQPKPQPKPAPKPEVKPAPKQAEPEKKEHKGGLKVGDQAPDFILKNQEDKEISLKSLLGKKVLLSFHPLAWTPVCEIQMKTLELKKGVFEKLNTIALGLSVDSMYSKREWATYLEIENTHLLADFWPHGDVAKKYGQFIEKAGVSGRANILIDEKGKVMWMRVYEIPQVPDIEEVIKVIQQAKK